MKKNMGGMDRSIRFMVGVIFGILYFTGIVTSTFGYIVIALSVVFLLTSIVGSCPLYSLVGLNTCTAKK